MDCKNLRLKLLSGNLMPIIGFGTYRIRGTELIRDVLDYALSSGYRSIDTAYVYGNEKHIGEALKDLLPKYNLKREDIFIITKLPPSHHGDKAVTALRSSLENLDCGYVDLYLIHWPGQAGSSIKDSSNRNVRTKTWQYFVDFKKKGLVRNIGVSNYTISHLEELIANSFGEVPVVNQVEWHPHYHPSDLLNYCQKHGILLQAYSSLGGTNNSHLISDSEVVEIAKRLDKQPAQILLRWALQQNIAIIPKGCSKEHIQANIDLNFEIPEMDMTKLNNLKVSHKYAWNPDEVL
ncbi:hypothetical protein Trydic_g16592 [Trypoxylus dichotomus]